MQIHTRYAALLPFLLALLFALLPVIAAVTLVLGLGGGHPPLGGVLMVGTAVPTLAAYLSRALEGTDFPSPLFLVLGALEYPLVGYGVGSLVAHVKSSSRHRRGIKQGQSPDTADAFLRPLPRRTSSAWSRSRQPLPTNGHRGRLPKRRRAACRRVSCTRSLVHNLRVACQP
jgi:hypothetical protein